MNKLVIPALTIMLCVACAGGLAAQEIFQESRNLYSTRALETSAKASARSVVKIESALTLQGNLKIGTTEDLAVKVTYAKKAKVSSKSKAIDFIDQIAVNLVKVPDGVKLEMRAPNPAPWSENEMGSVEATVEIPRGCRVEIDAYYFDIEAEGPFESFVVPSSLGRLSVSHVTDLLHLETSNRRVNIDDISGKIKVATTNSSLNARDIFSGEGQAMFRNEGGDIKIYHVVGAIDVKNSYGRTEIDRFSATGQKSYVKCSNGPVGISVTEMGEGQLIVTNRFEDIEFSLPSNVSAEFSLAVEEDGKIEVYNFPFKPDLIQRNRLSLIAGEGAALISGSVRGNGNVYVRGYDPED